MESYKTLENLSHDLRCEATYLEMEYHLKNVIEGKEDKFLKDIDYTDRNIGKSCALARLSVKYDIPVIVPNVTMALFYTRKIPQYIPEYFTEKLPKVIVVNEYSRGKRFDYVLLEEGLDYALFNIVVRPMVRKGVVGYKNFYFSEKCITNSSTAKVIYTEDNFQPVLTDEEVIDLKKIVKWVSEFQRKVNKK